MGKNINCFNVNDYRTYTWTICINVNDTKAKFAMVIDFLCLFMPITIAKRIICAVFLISGAPRQFLVDMGLCCLRSAGTYDRMIKNGHFQELFSIRKLSGRIAFYKGVAHSYIDEIKNLLDSRDFYCYHDIQKALKDEFGLTPSLSAIRYTFKKWGYKWRKCGSLPAKADPVLQKSFYENTLHPLMNEAQAGKCHLFFMDAAHFVYGCGFLGRIFSRTRRFIKTHCGRQRYNVLGALDFVTKEVVTVTNTKYITATQIVEMLGKLHKMYGNDGIPIKIVLDNARYQKCEVVTNAEASLRFVD